MDPAQALADLTEISPQLETAVLAAPDGSVVASTIGDEVRSGEIATNAVALLEGARSVGSGGRELTQVQTATREGCVFVVRDDRFVLAAVTGADPTVGLVFYDLKATLRQIDTKASAKKPRGKPKAAAKPKAPTKPKATKKRTSAKAKPKPEDGASAEPGRTSSKRAEGSSGA